MKNRSLPAEQEAAARRFVADCLKREGFRTEDPERMLLQCSPGDSLVVASLGIRLVSPQEREALASMTAYPREGQSPPLLLAAPARALRRQQAAVPMEDQAFGRLTLRHGLRRVELDGVPLPLTLREYELLSYLCLHKNLVLTRAQIIAGVWDIGYRGDDRTVDTHIKCLRAKLGPYGSHIQTLRKVGYRFSWGED